MPRDKGFSLVELLICTTLSAFVLLGFLATIGHSQQIHIDLNLALERDENLWLTPLLLTRWVLHTGNNRWQANWSGVTVPGELLELNSDIDGPQGFPDGELINSFEQLSIRSSGSDLQLKSGDGTFQPVLKNIDRFTADDTHFPLLSIDLEANSERPFSSLPEVSRKPIHLLCFLRPYRTNLFLERPR